MVFKGSISQVLSVKASDQSFSVSVSVRYENMLRLIANQAANKTRHTGLASVI